MPQKPNQLLIDASDAGLHITGLDGWTQTRLAKTLQIRRETLNAIINRAEGSEPTPDRPRMTEACQKLITFAAALSAKDDAVLKLPVDIHNLQSDDGQAYEHHRLRLHRLVEDAAVENQFTDALCRLGEFASAALNAARPYRLRMICNLVTSIQRLLDKPGCREVPAAVLRANVSRLYRAERAARTIARDHRDQPPTLEQVQYVRGQAGYGLVCLGMLLHDERFVRRGGKRLFNAVAAQPDGSYGHWCNLLRAVNDLMAARPELGRDWADRARAAGAECAKEFGAAYESLEARGEILRLRGHWASRGGQPGTTRIGKPTRRAASPRAMGFFVAMLLTLAGVCGSALAGDGRDFRVPPPTPPLAPAATSDNPPAQGGWNETHDRAPTRRRTDLGLRSRHERLRMDSGDSAMSDTEDIPPTDAQVVRFVATLATEENTGPAPRAAAKTPPPPPARAPVAKNPTDQAASDLNLAKKYVAEGNDQLARWKLRQIATNYPDTPAGKEAKRLVEQGK